VGEWRIHASAPSESLEATIKFANSAAPQLVGTMFMSEGWGEPLDYPLDSLSVRGDSIRFRFAPAAILVEGTCTSSRKIMVRFSPAWAPITGSGLIEPVR